MRVTSAVVLLALSACSESALKSALYNPKTENNSETEDAESAPPASIVNPRPEDDTAPPTVGSGERPTETAIPLITPDENRLVHLPRNSHPIRHYSQYPQSGMNFKILDSELLIRTLRSSRKMTARFEREALRAEVIEVRLELQSLRRNRERMELELEGYLVIVLKTPEGLLHVERLLNDGPVLYTADGDHDLMSARFSVRDGVSFEVSMSRLASRSVEKAMLNPWQGRLLLREVSREGESLIDLAEMSGFVSPL
jgi:hypothetical protein